MTYSSEVIGDSPLVYWRLGETSGSSIADSSGNSRTGTLSGTYTRNVSGLITGDSDTATDFTSGYGNIADASWMDTTGFTAECWFNADAVNSYRGLISRDGAAGGANRGWNLYVLDGKLHVFDGATGGTAVLTGTTTITTGRRYYAVLVSTGSHVYLYLDGHFEAAVATTMSNTLASMGLTIGASYAGAGTPSLNFDGKIDEVAYYGYALSSGQIAAHYRSGYSYTKSYTNLRTMYGAESIWLLGESSGTTMVDALGNHNGTIDAGVVLGAASTVPDLTSTGWTINAQEGGEVASNTWVNGDGSGIAAEIWFTPTTITDSVIMARSAVGAGNSVANKAWSIQQTTNGAVTGRLYTGTGATSTYVSSNGVLVAGQLAHIVLVHGSASFQVWVNGQMVVNTTLAGGPATYAQNTQPITIGRQTINTGTYTLDGKIQAAAFYGTALTSAQVQRMYREGIQSYSDYTAHVVDDEPYLYWKTDETSGTVASDMSGNGRPGTYFTSPTLNQTSLVPTETSSKSIDVVPGAAVFRTHETAMNNVVTGITVEGWYQFEGAPGSGGAHTLVAKTSLDAADSAKAWHITYNPTTDVLNWSIYYTSTLRILVTSATGLIASNTPYYIVGTYDGNVARLYLNGTEIASVTQAGTMRTSTYAVQFGKDSTSGSKYGMNGKIDEPVYYQYPLSASRIAERYALGSGSSGTTISGGQATETDTALPGSLVVGHVISGGQATETDTALAGTPLVGKVVSGGQATETDTALPGTLSIGGYTHVGGQATETDTALPGSVIYGSVVVGGQAVEVDQALAGTIIVPPEIETAAVLPFFEASTSITVPPPVGSGTIGTSASLPFFEASSSIVFEIDNSIFSHLVPWLAMPEGEELVDLEDVDERWYRFTLSDNGWLTMVVDNPSIQVTIYEALIDEPTVLAHLSEIWDTSLGNPFLLNTLDEELVYYVKVEDTDPSPTDFDHVLSWSRQSASSDPDAPGSEPDPVLAPYYDERATPYDLGSDEYGSATWIPMLNTTNEVGAPSGSAGTAWLQWTAPIATEFSGTFEFSESFILTIFVNGVQVEEQTGSSIEVEGLSVPDGATVEFRVATQTGGGSIDQINWGTIAEPAEPQNPSLFQYLRTEIYEADGATLITEVPRRLNPTFTSTLNEQGSGEVAFLMNDPIVQAYGEELFKHRNIVKFFIGEKCVFGFRIRSRSTTWVSTDEYAGLVRTVSGPSVENILSDAIVKHDRKPHEMSLAERTYSWASPQATSIDVNDWYIPSDWDNKIVAAPLNDPPGRFEGGNPIPAQDRAKFGYPEQWPDRLAQWMFIYQDKEKNRKFGTATRNFSAAEWKHRYYRRPFFLEEDTLIRFHATADDTMVLYLDGEKIMEQRLAETGYTSFSYVDIELKTGWHVIAAHIVARTPLIRQDDGTDAFLFSAMEIARNGKPLDVIFNSGNGRAWSAYYGDDPPGWTRAKILINFWREARNRDNPLGRILSLGFDGEIDSKGEPWGPRTWNKEVSIGTKGNEFVAMLTETGGFDVWVDPGTMELMAAPRRGENRSTSVRLEPGRNVLDWSVESVDEVENTFLVQYDGGWIEHTIKPSVQNYGESEGFLSLGEIKYEAAAKYVVRGLAKGLAWARNRSGSEDLKRKPANQPTGSVIAVHGAAPFFDYDVGDVISAMMEDGTYGPHRVNAITVNEDDVGSLSYDIELEMTKDA